MFFLMAEREGFEPSVQLASYGGLANRWFQPLTHLSINQFKAECAVAQYSQIKLFVIILSQFSKN